MMGKKAQQDRLVKLLPWIVLFIILLVAVGSLIKFWTGLA